jgi:eukaryotic-like serine/threonine-protein kinase
MIEDPKTALKRLSTPEFLAALERSGVLPDAKCREVQRRFARRAETQDSLVLAHQLIDEGTLTEFQARRLLWGKKRLSFGRYALLDSIGKGGRGRVFKARHRLMDRVVALKVMLPDMALNQGAVSRFFREMKIVALLENPHVVRAIDADVHEGCPYIVMEYLEGDDLDRVVARRGPLPPNDVIGYMVQAARGLSHAHAKGVIHRDIKPTNLFLVKSGIVKILDLGCGELVGMAGEAANVFDTDEGIVVGTTDFMSPEQVRDKPIDARTDLFSLGCTMYRLLTGEYAFPGITREDRLVKRIRERHHPITSVRSGLPDSLVAIVDRLLALRPDDRFASAADVADALEALNRPAGQSDRAPSAKPAHKPSGDGLPSLSSEPEEPLDWSMIESALRPTSQRPKEAAQLVERSEPKRRSTKDLSSHRQVLEEQGVETGRDVHAKYRQELIQMKKTMTELGSWEAKEGAPSAVATWLERIGEKIGDFLAEPSAGQIVICILLVVLAFVAAFAFLVG